jgi:hypothetical protein
MANTTFQGVVRSYGGGGKGVVTPGVMVQSVQFACDRPQLPLLMFGSARPLPLARRLPSPLARLLCLYSV